MKKVYSFIICIIFVICMTGCEKSPFVTAVTKGLSFTAQIDCEDRLIICDVVIDENGKGTYTALSPENFNFSYIFNQGDIEVKYKELTYSMNSALDDNIFYKLNSTPAFSIMLCVLDKVASLAYFPSAIAAAIASKI